MLNQDEISLLQKKLPFWEHLTAPQRNALLAGANTAHFTAGSAIHCGETDCIGLLVVKSGTIRTYMTSDEGREITLYRLEGGDVCILSASCVLEYIDFDVSIDAESDCELLLLGASVFSRLSSENLYVELFSYKLAAERFSDVMWAMQQILFMSFDKRLATFLLDESAKAGSNELHLTHEQIAKYLGSAREVVSRMMKYFAKEGYITASRGSVTLLDKKGLRGLL